MFMLTALMDILPPILYSVMRYCYAEYQRLVFVSTADGPEAASDLSVEVSLSVGIAYVGRHKALWRMERLLEGDMISVQTVCNVWPGNLGCPQQRSSIINP